MKEKSWLQFILLYFTWLLVLALMQFWMQSQVEFIGVAGGNVLMLIYAGLFLAGCLYFLTYFKDQSRGFVFVLMILWALSYLIIEGLSILFFVTLDGDMIEAIGLSVYETKDILKTLWLDLPAQFFELVTLKNAVHLLDVLYAAQIELGILSPLALFLVKKDCHKADKCV